MYREGLVNFCLGSVVVLQNPSDPCDLLTPLSGVFWSNGEKNQKSMSPTAWNNQVLFPGALTFDKNLWNWICLFTLFGCFIHFVLCNLLENCQSDVGIFSMTPGACQKKSKHLQGFGVNVDTTPSKNHEKNRSHHLYLRCLVVSGEKRSVKPAISTLLKLLVIFSLLLFWILKLSRGFSFKHQYLKCSMLSVEELEF